jgi:hypothetical protein
LGIGDQNTITTFFIPSHSKDRIEKFYAVDTKDLIEFLKIDDGLARHLLSLRQLVPRSLNAQASLTISDVARLAFYQKQFI